MGFSLKPCGLKPPPDGRAQDYGVWRDPQRHGAQQDRLSAQLVEKVSLQKIKTESNGVPVA
eukprot:3710761-Amphidinium_carterae.1